MELVLHFILNYTGLPCSHVIIYAQYQLSLKNWTIISVGGLGILKCMEPVENMKN